MKMFTSAKPRQKSIALDSRIRTPASPGSAPERGTPALSLDAAKSGQIPHQGLAEGLQGHRPLSSPGACPGLDPGWPGDPERRRPSSRDGRDKPGHDLTWTPALENS